ncbi:hypothetical protein ACFQJC_16850 [Haloferax namakaokahaiae]|uniref:Uncharacterized protein n=1 Tax=Haloferax namakaokahaiae TaxID=1748331 RepID=A0ABD5ZJ32_9EURY
MNTVQGLLDSLEIGHEASLIVKPPNRPDDRDDIDAFVVKTSPPYEFDDGSTTYRVVEDDGGYRVLSSQDVADPKRVRGELRTVVNMST